MFDLNLKDEEVVMRITARKIVTTKEAVANFVGNILTRAGGDVADKINLILTRDSIYLEYKGHAAIGYGEETRDIDCIPLHEIKDFSVEAKEEEELITITTNTKEFFFIRNNSNENSLAQAMARVIKDIK
ncbi:hypothetical protein ACPWSR_02880 [Alloiococcus sp. CFN-8]|uniref:hypothetical protein n=1 Tax=Alloiococcus sp. CFN-8 TaxID=3416081 RepID=UPI003CFB3F09